MPVSSATFSLMADIRRSTTPAGATHPIIAAWPRGSAVAPFRKLEPKRARDRIGFGEPQPETLADAISFTGFVADQLPGSLVVAEIFLPQILGENEPVAAEIFDRGEE